MVRMVNLYGETVVVLEPDGYGFYKFPDGFKMDNLAVGDVYEVVDDDDSDDE